MIQASYMLKHVVVLLYIIFAILSMIEVLSYMPKHVVLLHYFCYSMIEVSFMPKHVVVLFNCFYYSLCDSSVICGSFFYIIFTTSIYSTAKSCVSK